MSTKSTGNKKDGSRYVVVHKKPGKKAATVLTDPFLPLPQPVRALIDGFLARHPLDTIQDFDPLRMRTQPAAVSTSSLSSARPHPRLSAPHPGRPAYLSNPRYQAMLPVRARLPISAQRQAILSLFASNQVVVLSGETGCGKVRSALSLPLTSPDPLIAGHMGLP